MFSGFDAKTVPVDETSIFVRAGGSGPPLLLCTAFPKRM